MTAARKNAAPKNAALEILDLSKTFTLHSQGERRLGVFDRLSLRLDYGDCMVLAGESGVGKSSLMRMIYGNYRCLNGRILVDDAGAPVDVASANARTILRLRRDVIGYVSQFLRVVPRVPALEVVAEPLLARGAGKTEARDRAAELLARLNVPEALWPLSPTTFSGGEQQRINIARGFAADYPILLLDEPTASLDRRNRDVVLDLIREAAVRGAAVLGIFHDPADRDAVCNRSFDVTRYKPA